MTNERTTTRLGRIDLLRNEGGEYWFNLKASNYQVIATSEMYTTRRAALNGIKSVRRFANNAPVIDKTGEDASDDEVRLVEAVPVTEEAVTEEAVTEEVVTEEAVTEEVVTEEVVTEEAVTEEVVTQSKTPKENSEK